MKETDIIAHLIKFLGETPRHDKDLIMGSMTTLPDPLSIYAYTLFIHTNSADSIVFQKIHELEENLIREVGESLFKADKPGGMITSGGTESNYLAIVSALRKYGRKTVVAPDTVHVSVRKACMLFGCRLELIPSRDKPVDPGQLEDYVRKYRPSIIIVTAGTTERGLVDPIKEAGEIASKHDVWLHVDAAYGGLLVPFYYEKGIIDENLAFYEGVTSISVDFHKLGRAPIPSSLYILAESRNMDYATYPVEYMPSGQTRGLLGTRPGASIVATWTVWKKMGLNGYSEQAIRLHDLAILLYEKLRTINNITVLEPILPIIVFKHRKIPSHTLLRSLLDHGVYVYKAPTFKALRIVIMPHISENHIEMFIEKLKTILDRLEEEG